MIPVFIDTMSLSEEFAFDESLVEGVKERVVSDITAGFIEELEGNVMNGLGQTREQYLSNINVIDEGRGKGSVVLTGRLPNMIESGAPAFDMKPGLLNGPNSKVGPNGKRYNTVPYRFGVPTTLGEDSSFSGILPQSVYDAILKKKFTVSLPGGGSATQGLKPKEIPKEYREPQTKKVPIPGTQKTGIYKHKASIYQGVRRQKDPVTNQRTYRSFRRVSENSDPLSWIHPGFKAKNFFEASLQSMDMETILSNSIDNFLAENGFY